MPLAESGSVVASSLDGVSIDLFNATGALVWRCDSSGRLVDANPAFVAAAGRRFAELHGAPLSEVQPPDAVQGDRDAIGRVLRGEVVGAHSTALRGPGGVVHLAASLTPLRDATGAVIGWWGLGVDVSRERQGAHALRETLARYEAIGQHAEDIIWSISLRTNRHAYVTPSAEKILGYKPEELLERSILDIIPPAEHARIADLVHGAIASLGTGDLEATRRVLRLDLIRRDGSSVPTEVSARLVVNDAGEPVEIVGITRDVTQRLATEKALRESEARYRFIAEHTEDVIWTYSFAEKRFTFVSPSVVRLLGMTPEEGTQKGMPDLLTPESLARVKEILAQASAQRRPGDTSAFRFISRVDKIHKDGRTIPAEVAVTFLFDDAGAPSEIVGVSRDLSARILAEQKLRDSEERYRIIVERAPIAICQTKLDGELLYANPAMVHQLGCESFEEFSRAFLSGAPQWLDVDRERFEEALVRDGSVYGWEARLRARSGELRHVMVTAFLDRATSVVNSFMLDLTERRAAEDALAAERDRLRTTLRSIGDGVITTDDVGRVLILNKVAESLTGWTQAEAQGQPLASVLKLVEPSSRVACDDAAWRVLSQGRTSERSELVLLVSRDGSTHLIADTGAPITDASGAIVGAVVVFRDITERQRLLETVQRADKLESLGVLAGGIAHDFNNLLAGVFGHVDLARQGLPADGAARGHLDSAMTAFSRARDLTRQLLTFAKGGQPVRTTGDVGALIGDNVRFALSGSQARCNLVIADGLFPCDFDAGQIAQVVGNLAINAQQAMPEGGTVTVRVGNVIIGQGAHPSLREGPYVRVSVEDTGVGIPVDLQRRIFDPFFSTKQGGTGLGLATCYSVVQRHLGWIDVESEPGKGATFHVYLPASPTTIAHSNRPASKEHAGSGTVIVMDDESFMRTLLGKMLSKMGYEMLGARDGDEAMSALSRAQEEGRKVAFAILDLTIPGGRGGRETIALVRARYAELPVFASSGYSDDSVMAHPAQYGFTDSIPKPYVLQQLADLLNRHFSPG